MIRSFLFVLLVSCFAANGQDMPAAMAKRLLSLPGTYTGKLPCADCDGIERTLSLQCDPQCHSGRYLVSDKYIDPENGNRVKKIKGHWVLVNKKDVLDKGLVVIMLSDVDREEGSFYEVDKDGLLTPVTPELKKYNTPADITLKKL